MESHDKSLHKVFWVIVFAFTAVAVYFSLHHRHLYSDGSYQLLQILSTGDFFHPQRNRILATLLNQSITVGLLSLGVKDVSLLSFSFGLNHHLVLIVGLVLSYFFIGAKKELLILPLCSFLLIYINHSLQIAIEPHMSAALVWPCFLLLLADKEPPIWKYMVSWFFILGLSFSYEGNFILCLFLLISLAIEGSKLENRIPKLMTMIFLLIAFFITLYGTLYVSSPVIADNRATVFYITSLLAHPVFWMSLFTIGSLLGFTGVVSLSPMVLRLVFIISLISVVVYAYLFSDYMLPHFQHRARGLNQLAPLFFMSIFLFLRDRDYRLKFPSLEVLAASLVIIAYQFQFGLQWNRFKEQMNHCMEHHSGVIEINACRLSETPLIDYSTNWTRPYLSILLQAVAGEPITTVVNSTDYPFWQYWDAENPTAWPDLSGYDVHFDQQSF